VHTLEESKFGVQLQQFESGTRSISLFFGESVENVALVAGKATHDDGSG
jgi:hypothetical protein